MAEDVQDSKLNVPEPHPEAKNGRSLAGKQAQCAGWWTGRVAAGQPQGSAAGVRGGGMWKPNRGLTFNRRAEGTSELNSSLGAGGKGAGALERCGFAGDFGRSLAGRQARCARVVRRWQSSRPANGQHCRSARAWNVEARARPNVEVNRRAEGTSELNRRLGAVVQGAAALECCGAAGDYGRGLAGKQA